MIWIIQCLCENRHAIYGIAYEPEELPHDVVRVGFQQLIEDWIKDKAINPWCGICESESVVWTYDQRSTKYQTMEEAKADLKRVELEMMLSRILIDESKAAKN